MKQKEQKNGMNPSQEQFPAVEMRVNRLGTGDGHCLAHLSVTLGGVFAVRGLRLMEGKNGPFSVTFPVIKAAMGIRTFRFPVSAQLRQQMTDAAVTAYHQVLDRHQAETAAQSQAEPEEPEPASGIGMQMYLDGGEQYEKEDLHSGERLSL